MADRPPSTRVLLVEDDPNIVDLVRSNLVVRGYAVDVATSGDGAADRVGDDLPDAVRPDIVLLDLMLPGTDGFEVCRAVRERSSVGIIVVSARAGEGDKVRALNLGADDYMTKPFGVDELLARITATLRRTRPTPTPEGPGRIVAGDVVIDLDAGSVTKAGERIHLTPTELSLLRELAVHRGALQTHASLLRNVWGPGYERETEYLRVYVRRLRAKLDGDGPTLIVTEPRLGYRFEAP
ncbi:MAG TPA: response regulator transcription factor [Acidimicrobiales bacterium]|nr:response regulator transcription factor [Acidimicrobiales bacterium]